MSPIREKSQIFLLGLMLGLLIGVAFFIFKMDDYFRELSFYKNSRDTETQSPEKVGLKKNDRLTFTRVKNKNKNPGESKLPEKDSSSFEYSELPPDSSSFPGNSDSLQHSISYTPDEDGLVFKRDELLAVRSFDVQNLDLVASSRTARDSLLSELSGVQENEPVKAFTVEYWKSPINYKGYKMSRNKLILYGINSGDPLRIYRLDDNIYVKHSATTYRVNYTDNFRQLDRETDAQVLVKFGR